MVNFLPAMCFVLFFLAATFGFGRLLIFFLYKNERIGWAFCTTLGIASWITYGGVLNFFQVVSPATLKFSMYTGCLITLGFFVHGFLNWTGSNKAAPASNAPHTRSDHPNRVNIAFSISIFMILSFCVYYLMPSRALNFHDDFHYYLHPSLQLLANGSFPGNLFSALGYNTMGGQLFMKSLPYLYFDIRYANTFDAVICFFLGLALIFEFGRKIKSTTGAIIIASILFIFINPQIVNTSSLYSGALIIIGLFFAISMLKQDKDHNGAAAACNLKEQILATIPVALFFSALTTLKATLIIFAVLFFIFRFSYEIIFLKSKKSVIDILWITLFSAIFVAPWLFSTSTKYLDVLAEKINSHTEAAASSVGQPLLGAGDFSVFFAKNSLFWGNNLSDYFSIFLALLLATIICFFYLLKEKETLKINCGISISAGFLALFCSVVIIGNLIYPLTALRYVIPIIIGIFPVSTLYFGALLPNPPKFFFVNVNVAALLLSLHLMIAGMFTAGFIDRVEQIKNQHHLNSFPISDQYLQYMDFAMSDARKKQIAEAQSVVPKDSNITAWVSTPFYLDYRRNKISVIETFGGVGGAFMDEIPYNVDNKTFWQFFRNRGIDFIIWEYDGFAVKDDRWYQQHWGEGAWFAQYFIKSFPLLANNTNLIYHKNSIIVLDIRIYKEGENYQKTVE